MMYMCNSYTQWQGTGLMQRKRTDWEVHCSQTQPGVTKAQQDLSWFGLAKVFSCTETQTLEKGPV